MRLSRVKIEAVTQVSGTGSFFNRLINNSMRRILLRLWIFGLAFGLGISVSALWRLYNLYQLPEVNEIVLTTPVPAVKEVPLTIVGGMDACGPTANYHVYGLSDGSRISSSCESYASSAAAARALLRRLGKAQVAERSQNLDEAGRREGETVLVINPTALRLSTHGKTLCVTEAPTLKHLQMFGG
jgi:hypothetical protein